MTIKLMFLSLGLLLLGCNENNPPTAPADTHYYNNTAGCEFTRNIGYRTDDSIVVNIFIDKNTPSFINNYLQVSLYEFNRYVADVPACLVENRILKSNHWYGDTSMCSITFRFSRSDSLRYYFGAELFKDSTLSYDNRIMYSNYFDSHLIPADTARLNLLNL